MFRFKTPLRVRTSLSFSAACFVRELGSRFDLARVLRAARSRVSISTLSLHHLHANLSAEIDYEGHEKGGCGLGKRFSFPVALYVARPVAAIFSG
jgi:hypothetical protein